MSVGLRNNTLEQRRMTLAYRTLEKLAKDDRETWKRAASGLGPEIQRSGLLQALAFLHRGPSEKIAEALCAMIREHLCSLGHLQERPSNPSFLVEVRDLDRAAYMRVTRETLALAVWLKRAGEILAKDKG
ncbi:MAG: type III-B CRISPR module-associated protein Cmr5 [Gammaproteobacteria bacterium]